MANEENKKEPCKLKAGECVPWSDAFLQCEIEQDACIKFDVDDPAQKEKLTKVLAHPKKLKAVEISASTKDADAGESQVLVADPSATSLPETQAFVAQPGYPAHMPPPQPGISTTTLMTAGTAAVGATMMAVKFMKAASSASKGKSKGKGKHDHHDQDRQQQEEQRQECKSAAVNCAASTRALNERADYLTRQISSLEEELQNLSNPSSPGNQTASKIKGVNTRIDELEEKLESQEKLIKKLMSKLAAQ